MWHAQWWLTTLAGQGLSNCEQLPNIHGPGALRKVPVGTGHHRDRSVRYFIDMARIYQHFSLLGRKVTCNDTGSRAPATTDAADAVNVREPFESSSRPTAVNLPAALSAARAATGHDIVWVRWYSAGGPRCDWIAGAADATRVRPRKHLRAPMDFRPRKIALII